MNQAGQIILHTGKFLTLIKAGHWEYVDRVHGKGVALIIGVTTEKKLLLVEQYRIPVHARTIELPAGIIGDEPGDAHESSAAAARRELSEETHDRAKRSSLAQRDDVASVQSQPVHFHFSGFTANSSWASAEIAQL